MQDTAAHVALEQAAHPPQAPTPLRAVLRAGTWADRRLSSVSAAGLANNLNDAYAWALLPLLLLSRGLTATQTAAVAAVYPAVWGLGQLGTGALSDRIVSDVLGARAAIAVVAALTAAAGWRLHAALRPQPQLGHPYPYGKTQCLGTVE